MTFPKDGDSENWGYNFLNSAIDNFIRDVDGRAALEASQLSTEEAFIESLRKGWRQIIGVIAAKNRQSAIELISDEWHEFQRLAITPPSLNTPEQFVAVYISMPKPDKTTSKAQRTNP